MVKRTRADINSDLDDDASSDYSDYKSSSAKAPPKKSRKIARSKCATVKRAKSEDEDVSEGITTIPHSTRTHIISSPQPLQKLLLEWYNCVSQRRGMPWRKAWDPNLSENERAQRAYEVWVSEIMLQQTQVATVIPFYNAWMEKFPTLPDLAAASIDEVNAMWKGLGYYSRASRLLAGAQKAVKSFQGKLPPTAAKLQAEIPGIGRYSAGAIASIALGERAPVLDGNVHRLLSRILGLYANPKAKSTLDILWSGAEAIVEQTDVPSHPGDINQALIELGSTVCKVQDPTCDSCPLRTFCVAYTRVHAEVSQPNIVDMVVDMEDLCDICEPRPHNTSVSIYPMKAQRKKPREELDIVNVVEWRSSESSKEPHILMVKRPKKGLLAGLQDFPTRPNVTSSENLDSISDELLASFMDRDILSSATQRIQLLGDVLHVFSHIKKTYRVQHVVIIAPDIPMLLRAKETQWVPMKNVAAKNIGTGVAKIWKLVDSKLKH